MYQNTILRTRLVGMYHTADKFFVGIVESNAKRCICIDRIACYNLDGLEGRYIHIIAGNPVFVRHHVSVECRNHISFVPFEPIGNVHGHIIHIAITTGAGIGGISLLRAGGRGDGGGVGVSCFGAANGAYAVGKAMPAVLHGAVGVGVALEEVFGERLGQERVPLGVDVYAVAARLAYVGVLRSMVINAAVLVGVEDGNAVLCADLKDRRAKLTKRVALLIDLVLRPVVSSSRDGIPGGDQGRDEDEFRLCVGLLLAKGLDLLAPCAHGAVDRGGVLASLFAKQIIAVLCLVPIVDAHHDRDERRSVREVIQLFDVAGTVPARAKHGSACAAVDGARAQKIGKKGDVILGSDRGSDARRDAVTDADDGLARIEIRGTGIGNLDLRCITRDARVARLDLAADRAAAQVLPLRVTARRRDLGPRGEGVLRREKIDRVMLLISRHGQIERDGTLGCGDVAVLRKLGIHLVARQRLQHAVLVKPGHANAVCGTAVIGVFAQRGSPDAIPCLYRESNRPAVPIRSITPAVYGIVDVFGLESRPEVGARANVIGKLLQMPVCVELALYGNDKVSRHVLNINPTVFIARIRNIHTAHRDADGQIVSRKRFREAVSCGDALIVRERCGGLIQFMRYGINRVLTCLNFHVAKQLFHHRGGDEVHALGVGVNAVGEHSRRDAAPAQIQRGNAVVVTDRLHHGDVEVEFCLGGIARHGVGGDGEDLGVGVKMLQTQDRGHVGVRKAIPLGCGQICLGGRGGGIKAAKGYSAADVVARSEEQDHVGRAVCAEVLNARERGHSGVLAEVSGVAVDKVADGGACPAIVDAQLGVKILNELHPPGLVDVGEQIVLRIARTVSKIEAVGLGNVALEGGGACRKNGDHLALIRLGVRV